MYAYIKGLLTEVTLTSVIVETAGIGYRIYIPVHLFSSLPKVLEHIQLHTSFVIRENSETLYGFLSAHERDLFEILQGVTGIGPKLSLCIIGHMSAKDLKRAISHHDIGAISKIPGIGKKMAERLIIEMKDKLETIFRDQEFSEYRTDFTLNSKTSEVNDAMSALINLGYNQMTAQKAIKKTLKELPDENIELGTLIAKALQHI